MKDLVKKLQLHLSMALFIVSLAMLIALPVQAHHNYFADFNPRVEITIEGVVSRVDYRNPHIEIYVDVLDDEGNIATWRLPNAGPGVAQQNGWGEDTVVVGEHLTFKGWPARDGSNSMRAIEMFFTDGRSYEMQMWCKLNCAGHDLDGN